MMHRPWDCAQPDEWLPQSLRLCWGGDGGGGGFSGDGGGFGGATTGGGDWGSSGSFDASGFNSGFEGPGTFGAGGSEFGFGQGGGGGDWGSFGPTSYGGFNAPNAIFTDIAGPNPGVTTGGGDWGSAGAYSAAGMGGGQSGGLWGGDTGGGGGVFGDYGGGGGGYTGGGGGGGGSFGGFGTGGGGGRSGGGFVSSPYADDTGPAGRGESEVSSPYADDTGPAGRGESEVSSPYADDTGPTGRGEQDTVGPAPEAAPEADFGKPAAPEAAPEAAPSESRSAPSESRSAPSEPEAEPSSFGPESLDAQAAGEQGKAGQQQDSFDSRFGFDVGPQAEPGWFESLTQDTTRDDPSTLISTLSNWFSNIQNAPVADRTFVNPITNPWTAPVHTPANPITNPWTARVHTPEFEVFNQNADTLAQSRIDARPLSDINTWLSAQNQNPITTSIFNTIANALSPVDETSSMGRPGELQSTAFDQQALGEQGKAGQQTNLSSQLGTEDITSAPTQDTTPWGSVFEGAAPPAQDLASQLGTQDIDTTPWGSVFEAPEQAPDYASVFEGATPAIDDTAFPGIEAFIPGGRETDFTGYENLPGGAISAFIPGGRETNFDYDRSTTDPATAQPAPTNQPSVDTTMESGPAVAPTTTDTAATKGGDPALSGSSADAAAAAPGQAQEGGGRSQSQGITLGQLQDAVYGTGGPYITPGGNVYGGHTIADIQAAVYGGNPPGMPTGNPNADLSDETSQPSPQATPPSLIEQAQQGGRTDTSITGGRATDFNYDRATTDPQQQPQPAPAAPAAPADEHEDEADPHVNTPVEPGRPLGAPTTRTQDTPVNSPRVRQEQQGATRNRPVSQALHGILTRAAEQANVIVRVGSGGQPSTGRDRTGSHRHDHGNAADIRLEQNGRLLNYNNPQDRVVMEAFVREAARLGATGMGAGMRYMGPNTIHVGFGGTNFWRADNPGSLALRQAWNEGRQGPANRPPADIPNVRTAQPAIPLPGRRPTDAPQVEIVQPQLPADIPAPTALPPPDRPLAPPRPPADIPAPAPFLTPPARGRVDPMLQARFANDLLKDATKNLNKNSGEAEFAAASVVGAKALAAAGIPLAMARSLMTQGAYAGAAKNGYDVNSFPMGGIYKSKIDGGIDAALQGYQPAKPGEVQGPYGFQPDAPGKQGALPSGQQYASPSLLQFVAGGREQADMPTLPGEVIPSEFEQQQGRLGTPEWETPARLDPFGPPETRPSTPMPAPPPALRDPNELGAQPGFTISRPSSERQASLLGLLHLAAGGRDAGAPPAIGPDLGPGRSEWESSRPGGPMGFDPNVLIEGPQSTPPAPPPAFQAPNPNRPGIDPYIFMLQQLEQQQYQQDLQSQGWRALAKGGHVAKDEPVVVGEEGPETFVPDQPGTVVPHMPQTGKSDNVDRWPKLPAPEYPGRYGGVEREINRQTRAAQNPIPSLVDLIDSGQLRLTPNWRAMLNDPALIALGRSRMGTVDAPAPEPAAEPPDPTSPMAQALGYGSIRRPLRVGRQSY